MAQKPGTTAPRRPKTQPGNDIYTVLASIGLAIVLGTIGFVIYRCVQLFDTPLP